MWIGIAVLSLVGLSVRPLVGLAIVVGTATGLLVPWWLVQSGMDALFFLVAGFLWIPPLAGRLPVLEGLIIGTLLIVVVLRTRTIPRLLRAPGAIYLGLLALGAVVTFALNAGSSANLDGELYVVVHSAFLPLLLYPLISGGVARGATYERLCVVLLVVGVLLLVGVVSYVPGMGWNPIERITNVSRSARFQVPGYPDTGTAATMLSQFASMLVPICCAVLASPRSRSYRLFGLVSLLGLVPILFLLGTRFSWVSSFFGLFIFLILVARGWKRVAAVIGFGLVVLIVIVLTTAALRSGRLDVELTRRIESLTSVSTLAEEASVERRLTLWGEAAALVAETPGGVGYLPFVAEHGYWSESTGVYRGHNTHNEFLLVGLGAGWVGLAALVLFLLTVLRWFLRRLKRGSAGSRYLAAAGLSLLAIFVTNAMFDTYSNNSGAFSSLPLFWLGLGLLVGSIRIREASGSRESGGGTRYVRG